MERRVNIWKVVDRITILIFLLLVLLGWLNIYAAVYNEEHTKIFDFSQRYGKQMVWIITTLMLAVALLYIDNRFYFFFSYIIYGFSILLLMAVLIFGKEVFGTKAWFEIGPVSIQPSEFAKAATALAIARYLNSKGQELTRLRVLLPVTGIILLPALLTAMQPDMGTTVVYLCFFLVLFREGLSPYVFVTGLLMVVLFFFALLFNQLYLITGIMAAGLLLSFTVAKSSRAVLKGMFVFIFIGVTLYSFNYFIIKSLNINTILLLSLILSGAVFSWYFYRNKAKGELIIYLFVVGSVLYVNFVDYLFHNALKPHQKERIEILLRKKSDPRGTGYNINQSVISIGSGGFLGKGYLRGTQTKFKFVPAQSTDFIFCTVGEEWGFAGSAVVIILYMILLIRLQFLAERQRSAFSRIFGYGVISVLLVHFFINIGMVTGILPVIGIPLPFFSYGGSSLWGFTILLFIFLRLDAARHEYLI